MLTNDTLIENVLKSIDDGKMALPDFQRGWVWDDDHIKSLLASISLGFPVGAVMMLESGGKDIRFKTRLVEGVDDKKIEPELLILDGQQRLTSLYLASFTKKPVTTKDVKKNDIKRWYYLDINKCISSTTEREEAIISLPEDKKTRDFRGEIKEDISTKELEWSAEFFPLNIIFDSSAYTLWSLGYYQTNGSVSNERVSKWTAFFNKIIDPINKYQIPIIKLGRETPKEAVCQVFEKVNTGGVTLNVFELLTATFAVDDYNLRADWDNISRNFHDSKKNLLSRIENTYFLQVVTLLATHEKNMEWRRNDGNPLDVPAVSCRRRDILKLDFNQYRKWKEAAISGFESAAKLIHTQKIFSPWDLPYQTQLVPLAAVLALKPAVMDSAIEKEKLLKWYWCGVLGELYHGATETRFAKDLVEILNWLEGGNEPSTIVDANFAPVRLFSMCTRNSAAYKGISSLLLRSGACDFMNGQTIDDAMYHDENMDIHHIFPRQWCLENNIRDDFANCVVNKTFISARTNRIIGNKSPCTYITNIQNKHNSKIDAVLESHKIDPVASKADDFKSFFIARMNSIIDLVSTVMGKPVSGQMPALESLVFEKNKLTQPIEVELEIED